MDIAGRNLWQHAAGDNDRNYVDLCLKWSVLLNGPGHLGPWPDCRQPLREEGWTPKKLTGLQRFCEGMCEGDIVVLRTGTNTVHAVGEVVGEYAWCDAFGDVDGWKLQHVRRVRWLWIGPRTFDTYALKLGDTTQSLGDGAVRDWLESLEPNQPANTVLPALPYLTGGSKIDYARISEFLFDRGVASASISRLMDEIGELTRIARWYGRAESKHPSEHETVAYLVVPLLRALGWTPQRMGIEWNYLDAALFDSLPRSDETLQVVVEAKRMDKSCLSAKGQAAGYAEKRPGCRRLIVTDGIRYGVYVKAGHGEFELYAYLNLSRLRDEYPIYSCQGAEEALLAMSPDWRPTKSPELKESAELEQIDE